MAEIVPNMHMRDRRKIRENYVCAYSLARLLTADLASLTQPHLPGEWMGNAKQNNPYWP